MLSKEELFNFYEKMINGENTILVDNNSLEVTEKEGNSVVPLNIVAPVASANDNETLKDENEAKPLTNTPEPCHDDHKRTVKFAGR